MLKKNMRKRLLAGALATIMALTMCPTWALADDEGVTTLPDIENSVPVVDSAPAVDPTETPDVLIPRRLPRTRIPLRLRLTTAQTAVRTLRSLAIIAVPMKMILRIMMQKAMLRKMKLACRSHKSI